MVVITIGSHTIYTSTAGSATARLPAHGMTQPMLKQNALHIYSSDQQYTGSGLPTHIATNPHHQIAPIPYHHQNVHPQRGNLPRARQPAKPAASLVHATQEVWRHGANHTGWPHTQIYSSSSRPSKAGLLRAHHHRNGPTAIPPPPQRVYCNSTTTATGLLRAHRRCNGPTAIPPPPPGGPPRHCVCLRPPAAS